MTLKQKPLVEPKATDQATQQSTQHLMPKQTAKTQAAAAFQAQQHFQTIVIGAGISGVAAAVKLRQAGLHDFVVLEKAHDVGGAWRDNTYPGCGCDVPSALYSFSFAPSQEWSHLFAKQPEIHRYVQNVVKQFDLDSVLRFGYELLEARWDATLSQWQLTTSQGNFSATAVIFATGPITEPQTPNIEGLAGFTGEMFHSARWRHDIDLRGKRIAVIGTGASAIQFIPQIQPLAAKLTVFQRTAPWVLPKPDLTLGSRAKTLLRRYPAIQQQWRTAVAGSLKLINFGLRHPDTLQPVSWLSKQLLKLQVHDPILRKKITPNFTIGCKRLLFANNYYPALQANNCSVVASGLVKVEGNTVIAANGERAEVDVIIWGTGFEVAHPPIGQRVINAKGQRLSELWQNSSPEAYLGTAIQDTPNAFLVLGPNILVYDSFIGIAEAQLQYIVDGLKQLQRHDIAEIVIKKNVLRAHNEAVQEDLQHTVFNRGGCSSYYLDAHGRNFAAWPWSLDKLKQRLQRLNLSDYELRYKAQALKKAG